MRQLARGVWVAAVVTMSACSSSSPADTRSESAVPGDGESTVADCDPGGFMQPEFAQGAIGGGTAREAMQGWWADLKGSGGWHFPPLGEELQVWEAGDSDGWRYRDVAETASELLYLWEGEPILVASFAFVGQPPRTWLLDSLQTCPHDLIDAGLRTQGTSVQDP